MKNGAANQDRTGDLVLTKDVLYQLSYGSKWSGKRDSNSRHSAWKADALPTELFPHLVQGEGFEPSKACAGRFTVCSHWPLGHPCIFLELAMGFEPATFCLQSSCSTVELRQPLLAIFFYSRKFLRVKCQQPFIIFYNHTIHNS